MKFLILEEKKNVNFVKPWQQFSVDKGVEDPLINFQHLLLQLQNLLFKFSHFGLFSVSGCLGCHPVLQFPTGRVERKKKN